MTRSCSVEGCLGAYKASGVCVRHYWRLKTYGDPLGGGPDRPRGTPEERFLRSVIRMDYGCLQWVAGRSGVGYGEINIDGEIWTVHRWAYQHWVGPIPVGYQIDHICHNRDLFCPGGVDCVHRICVELTHLEAVPESVNKSRGSFRRWKRKELGLV